MHDDKYNELRPTQAKVSQESSVHDDVLINRQVNTTMFAADVTACL